MNSNAQISGAAFAAVGDVVDQWQDLRLQDAKVGAGGGIRFQLDKKEKVNLRFDVGVSVIEPGNYKSDISATARARMAEKGLQNKDTKYADEWTGMFESPEDRSQHKEPDEVAEAIKRKGLAKVAGAVAGCRTASCRAQWPPRDRASSSNGSSSGSKSASTGSSRGLW